MIKILSIFLVFLFSFSLVRAEESQVVTAKGAVIRDSAGQMSMPDTVANILLNNSILHQTGAIRLENIPADSASIDGISTGEMPIPVKLVRIKDIDLNKYFEKSEEKKEKPLDGQKPAETAPVKPDNLMTQLRKGEVIKSMIPDTIAVDSAFLAKLNFTPVLLDTMEYVRNPLFNELVFMGKNINLNWRENNIVDSLFHGTKPRTLNVPFDTVKVSCPQEILSELRQSARDYITHVDVTLYRTAFDRLSKPTWIQNQTIRIKPSEELVLDGFSHVPVVTSNRIIVRRKMISPWNSRLNALLQFSQTAVSQNWHMGGYGFFSLLGGLSGNLDYDNRKKIRWENSFEWRTGFNTVTGDTIGAKGGRKAMPSDDVLKINSKFGLKATGNFYYSTTAEFQSQFFDNPKGINSPEMKARFLTPIRLNLGIGMEYKYKNLSINLAPLSFKYIYLTDTTTTADGFFIRPTDFGIETGENRLKEIGSKMIVELKDYSPIPELKINSRLNFYTNYKKVEIDWEIVAELAFNRFLSTRLMLNPRFDNTVIFQNDEKAKIQMKEMITVGISYRLL